MRWFKSKPETEKDPEFMELTTYAKDVIADVQMVFDHISSLNREASHETVAILTQTAVQAINAAAEEISTVSK